MAIAVIGAITKDIIEINGRREKKIGGTAFYSGITLANLGIKTQIFTKLSGEDKNLLAALKHRNISLFSRFCKSTTCFRNVYSGEKREQFVESIAEPFSVSDVNKLKSCNIAHLGPLTRADIPLEVVTYLKGLGLIISLDVQGYLRGIKNKKVRLVKWKDAKQFLRYADVIKADTKEAEILTGKKGKSAAKAITALGPREVIITDGPNGSLVYSDRNYFSIPAFTPAEIKDVTGCGDTYAAAYLAKRLQSNDLKECGLFAARCATAKIEQGVFNSLQKM